MSKLKTDYKSLKENKEMRIKEIRADEATNEDGTKKMVVEGYASVFDEETLIEDYDLTYIEVIRKGAFDDADFTDCCLKYNHGDAKGILARTRNGSLKCTVDEKGLFIRAELIDTTDNVDIYKCIKAGLLDKMSFCFTVEEHELDQNTKPIKRYIKKIKKVWDCAVVDVPAYDGTSIYARSRKIVETELNRSKSLENDKKTLENVELERLKAKIKGGFM